MAIGQPSTSMIQVCYKNRQTRQKRPMADATWWPDRQIGVVVLPVPGHLQTSDRPNPGADSVAD